MWGDYRISTSLVAALGFLVVGLLWSLSTFRLGFDLGWLLVAFLCARHVSVRLEGGTVGRKEWIMSLCYAVPGFLLEFLSDLSLYEFRQGEGPKYLTPFALFSYLFLLFITLAIAISRMGVAVPVRKTRAFVAVPYESQRLQ